MDDHERGSGTSTFDPPLPGRFGGRDTASKRWRLPAVLAVCIGVAVVAAAIARDRTAELRCEDGHLVAYQARFLPIGSRRLDPDRYPPLRVTPSQCSNLHFTSLDGLERRYVQLSDTLARSASQAESSPLKIAEWLGRGARSGGDPVGTDVLRSELEDARAAVQRARRRFEDARRSGRLEPERLRGLQLEYADILDGTMSPLPSDPSLSLPPADIEAAEAGDPSRAL